ncbi:MAG: glutathione S-transferase family protein [Gammaproteobacteria bacterium]
MSKPIVYGPSYSTYTRSVRLALEEKGAEYDLVEIDFMASGFPPGYEKRHPFSKVPAFSHGDFDIYETGAIVRYVDQAFDGPSLMPAPAREAVRVNQCMGIIDAYAYQAMVHDVFVQRAMVPQQGGETDEEKVAAGQAQSKKSLTALAELGGGADWLAGATYSLADLYFAPIMVYYAQTPEGKSALERCAPIARWWDRMSARDTMAKTTGPLG